MKNKLQSLIRQGHGSAILLLRAMSDSERHTHIALVTYALTNDLRYDKQCEPERTQYNLDLIESFSEPDRTVLQIIDEIVRTLKKPPAYRQFFRKTATSDNIRAIAEAARQADNRETKIRLYELFSQIDYPDDPTELLALVKENDNHYLYHALARIRHPDVRAYGIHLAENQNPSYIRYGTAIWTKNFDESTDNPRFRSFLETLPDDEDLRHNIAFIISHHLYDRFYQDPRTYDHLFWVYNTTPCSCCRRAAVQILLDHGYLTPEIREQCRFDCDPQIRKIVEKPY